VDTSTHHLSAFGHHVTIGTGFPIYEGGEEGLLPSVNILRFHRSTLASTIQTTFSKVSTDLIPAAPLWLRDIPRATAPLFCCDLRDFSRITNWHGPCELVLGVLPDGGTVASV
jgi:hypothetical protein